MTDGVALPKHVAIIPDGNRRWARERGLPTLEGHRRGLDAIKSIMSAARDMGISCLTVWGFSTENWSRDQSELQHLMDIFWSALDEIIKPAIENETRVVHLGRRDRLSSRLLDKIADVERRTARFSKHHFAFALDYGGRDEISRALKKIVEDHVQGEDIGDRVIADHLDTCVLPHPDPDLIIRTGGEMRLSGFMPWQSTYAELMFVKEYLPDFTVDMFRDCIREFGQRQRRFGT